MDDPRFLMQLPSGYVVMSQSQFLPGYCILIATPTVGALNDLAMPQRMQFFSDMSLIGDAVTQVCQPRRINYAILGNQDPYLHAHIIPRYDWEEPALKTATIWHYPAETLAHPPYLETQHGGLKLEIKQQLEYLVRADRVKI